MRRYSGPQIILVILAIFLPPVAVYLVEGLGVDFWINLILCLLAYIPASIHATWIWIVWVERKWETHHGREVTSHPFLVFSKEFEQRSRWKGNGQDGFFGYFDDDMKGATEMGDVGGQVDPAKARPV